MKHFLLQVLVLIFSCSIIFAQEEEFFTEVDVSLDSVDENLAFTDVEDFESSEEIDEWDDLFSDVEDVEELVEKDPVESKLNQIIAQTLKTPNIKFSGHFDGDLGIGLDTYKLEQKIQEKKDGGPADEEEPAAFPGFGYFLFQNSLNMNVKPSDDFQLRATLDTSVASQFSLALSSIYINYHPVDFLYLTAGKKSETWGYTRIFSDGDYYNNSRFTGPQLTNIMADCSNYFLGELKYPWSHGTVTAGTLYPLSKVSSEPPALDSFGYIMASEFSVPHFCVNLFARTYGANEEKTYKYTLNDMEINYEGKSNPLVGGEGKLSFKGYDGYAQGIIKFKTKENHKAEQDLAGDSYGAAIYEYGVATFGFYKLWDNFDPNFGFNFEYQYLRSPIPNDVEQQHKIALEAGVKRLGPKKNLKVGVVWNHNITEECGQVTTDFIISKIFHYASWHNAAVIQYAPDFDNVRGKFTTTISIDVDY